MFRLFFNRFVIPESGKNIPRYVQNSYHSTSISLCEKTRTLALKYKNHNFTFPLIWLRDNCQCTLCFHAGSYSRTLNWQTFDINVRLKTSEINEEKKELRIIWNDSHESIFKFPWLIDRNFSKDNQDRFLTEIYRPQKQLWDKNDFRTICQTFDFKDIIETDRGLKDWLEALARYGVAIIKRTPSTDTECRKIADRVGFIKKTHYGEEFIVTAKRDTSNVAYLPSALQLHTDLPYYEYKPGVNLLHCLRQSQSSGGHNVLTDAFHIARRMSIEYPEKYEILKNVLVNWVDAGNEKGNKFHSIFRAPVFCADGEGKLERINHSVPQRDSHFTVPLEMVEPWYQAMAVFVKLIHDESVSFKTQEGDILTFDNHRLVHGRTAYDDTAENIRWIVGAYLDWDEIYSRIRVLRATDSI